MSSPINFSSIWQVVNNNTLGTNRASVGEISSPPQLYYYHVVAPGVFITATAQCLPVIKADDGFSEFHDLVYMAIANNVICLKTNFSDPSNPYDVLWSSSFPSSPNLNISLVNFATGDDVLPNVMVGGSLDGMVYRLNPYTGAKTQATPGITIGTAQTYSSPISYDPLDPGKFYYFAASDGGFFGPSVALFKINSDGTLGWKTIYDGGWYCYTPKGGFVNISYIMCYGAYLYHVAGWSANDQNVSCASVQRTRITKVDKSTGTVVVQRNITSIGATGATFYPGSGIGGILYLASGDGVRSYNSLLDDPPISHHPSTGGASSIAVSSTGRLYYRASNVLYALDDDGNGNLTEAFTFPYLPSGSHTASPIIDTAGRIIVASNSTTAGSSNIHVFSDEGDYFSLITSFKLPFTGSVAITPSVGSSDILYIASSSNDILYAYGAATAPTTTTTTTTPSPTTTTTTSTGTGTTTTTTTTTLIPPTTTTTTTTPPPLAIVEISQFELVNGQFVSVQTSNASDSSTTQNSLLSQALTFGTIAPSETSKTIVVALNIPYAKAITNIKIGLVSSGGIAFANNIFGITSSVELRDDITPDSYFQGVNVNKVSTDSYNIDIRNKDNHTSEYVYLNVKLPNDQIIGEGMIKWKWFFDFAE